MCIPPATGEGARDANPFHYCGREFLFFFFFFFFLEIPVFYLRVYVSLNMYGHACVFFRDMKMALGGCCKGKKNALKIFTETLGLGVWKETCKIPT